MSERTKALSKTFGPDPRVLSISLRDASRGGSLEGVLVACEGLLARDPEWGYCVSCGRGRVKPHYSTPCDDCVERFQLPHTPQVREGLRWAVDLLGSRNDGYSYSYNLKGEAVGSSRTVWPEDRITATTIANLARLLPNPQPPMVEVVHKCDPCNEQGMYMVKHHGSTCEACGGRGTYATREPAPTHALSLYVDGLMLAKGERWAPGKPWVRCGWSLMQGSVEGLRRDLLLQYPGIGTDAWDVSPVSQARIYRDGTVGCGETCPPLPALEVTT